MLNGMPFRSAALESEKASIMNNKLALLSFFLKFCIAMACVFFLFCLFYFSSYSCLFDFETFLFAIYSISIRFSHVSFEHLLLLDARLVCFDDDPRIRINFFLSMFYSPSMHAQCTCRQSTLFHIHGQHRHCTVFI